MAHIAALAAAGGAWVYGAYTYDLQCKAELEAQKNKGQWAKEPHQGAWTDSSKHTFSDNISRGQFVAVQEDVDVRGARIFLVDYGTGSRVVSYTDPRVLH